MESITNSITNCTYLLNEWVKAIQTLNFRENYEIII